MVNYSSIVFSNDFIESVVFSIKVIDFLVRDLIHVCNKITDSIVRNRPTEGHHCLNLVSVCNSNFTHVVTKARNLESLAISNSTCNAHPVGDSPLCLCM